MIAPATTQPSAAKSADATIRLAGRDEMTAGDQPGWRAGHCSRGTQRFPTCGGGFGSAGAGLQDYRCRIEEALLLKSAAALGRRRLREPQARCKQNGRFKAQVNRNNRSTIGRNWPFFP